MNLKILTEKENKLFKRNEITGSIESETSPSRLSVLESLSKKFSVPVENIKIKKIKGNFGTNKFDLEANIYTSTDEKNIVEIKKKKETTKAVA